MSQRHSRMGFSLIEVLIGIVVLALGLLGIASVFPAVITQQRQTTDAVQGVALGNSATELIQQHRQLNERSVRIDPVSGQVARVDLRGWQMLLDTDPDNTAAVGSFPANNFWSRPVQIGSNQLNSLLYGAWQVGSDNTLPGLSMDAGGEMSIRINNGVPVTQEITIPLLDRSYVSNGQRYIWDFSARRVAAGQPVLSSSRGNNGGHMRLQDDSVQVAVFVRHADTVKVVNPAVTVITITEDANGRPTFDGRGSQYARIRSFFYTFVALDFDAGTAPTIPPGATGQTLTKIIVEPSTLPGSSGSTTYAQQINQKFVDQWGVVHTVTDLQKEAATGNVVLTITPAVSWKDAKDYMQFAQNPRLQMLFTTQVPAAVNVFTIRPQAAMGS